MAPSEHATVSPLKLMGLGLSAMLIPLGSTMIAVALPAIGSEFSRTPGDLTQWLVNSYLMINIIALGPSGKLGDHWGYANGEAQKKKGSAPGGGHENDLQELGR